jgi:hypothetical protein
MNAAHSSKDTSFFSPKRVIAMGMRPWISIEMKHFQLFLRVEVETLPAVREGLLAQTR